MRKKLLIVFVASLFLVTLTGCGSNENDKNKENESTKDIFDEVEENENEELEKAKREVIAEVGEDVVYWSKKDKKYHVDPDCPSFISSEEIFMGTVEDAFEYGVEEPCRRCIDEIE